MNRVAVLGSTGSIGVNCLEVAAALHDRVRIVGLTAYRNWELLAEQAAAHRVPRVVVGDADLHASVPSHKFPAASTLRFGAGDIERLAADAEVDTVISGIVGAAGLRGTWAALEAGKRVGLANKETLVVAGSLVMPFAAERGATVIPVDSEHSAVFQALQAGRRQDLRRIVLTASGGPFRTKSLRELADVTPAQALDHPNWKMGKKITIDSATMMNKALEIIEARWLFDLSPEQITVVVHPQSVLHSLVEFIDGSVVAQLSPPDMRLPIQYALTFPERAEGPSRRLDWSQAYNLEFGPPDLERFPALALGYEVCRRGGTCGAVLNAANEVAVERFLNGGLRFLEIPRACRDVLHAHDFDPSPTLDALWRADRWAREEMHQWRCLA